jgi:hypothetical protein
MATETQKIGTGMGMRNPLRDQKTRGEEAMIDIHREEKKDQRASGLGRTEIPVAVTKEVVMKRQNDMENQGDKTRLCQGTCCYCCSYLVDVVYLYMANNFV